VTAVVEDITLRIGKRSHRFAAVPHERCAQCGERIFGIDASKRFDAAILKRPGRRAA
jgi:YgiT-type zinc finger domain-containing protein